MSEKRVELSIKSEEKSKPVIPHLDIILETDGDDGIYVMGITNEGEDYYIINILSDGKFRRLGFVPGNIGLQVNNNGQILEAK